MTLLSLDRAWGGPGHLPLSGSLRVLLQVMSELRQLHEGHGETHGELTPALITLTDDSRVRLSAPAEPFSPIAPAGPYRLHYLAPEKLRGEAVGERADVFSVGVLLWEALAGKPMLELSALEDILARWRADMAPLAPVRDLHLWARSLSHIAARALAIEPTQRYANIRQFQSALETLAGRHAANLDAWDVMLAGPPKRVQSDAELAQLPDLSHLTGDAPRVYPFQPNSDDTVFDITARPPDLELDDDELPTRFIEPTPRPPSVAPTPSPRSAPARVPRSVTPMPVPQSVAPTPSPPSIPAKATPFTRPPITRARKQESVATPAKSAHKPAFQARTAWLVVVLLAAILGAVSAQLAQPARPAPLPPSAH